LTPERAAISQILCVMADARFPRMHGDSGYATSKVLWNSIQAPMFLHATRCLGGRPSSCSTQPPAHAGLDVLQVQGLGLGYFLDEGRRMGFTFPDTRPTMRGFAATSFRSEGAGLVFARCA